jgi:hypothetical protein
MILIWILGKKLRWWEEDRTDSGSCLMAVLNFRAGFPFEAIIFFYGFSVFVNSRGSSVSIALGYGLDDRDSRVQFPAEAGNFSLYHRVQNGSGTCLAPYPMGTGGSFPGVKRPRREADYSPISSAEVKEWLELYLHSSNTPSWRGTQLKKAQDNFAFYLFLCLLSCGDIGPEMVQYPNWRDVMHM